MKKKFIKYSLKKKFRDTFLGMILAAFKTILFIQKQIKMKKLIAILPLLLIMSCTQKEVVAENTTKNDSVILTDQNTIDNKMDSAANGIVSLDENKATKAAFKAFRVVDGDSIIKVINGDMLPLTISDEFTTDDQRFILKIKNFKGKKIVGKVTPISSNMNIRFNQIKFANGEFDGPFGADISEEIKEPGEIWLIIGKNLMADGSRKGKFTVSLK